MAENERLEGGGKYEAVFKGGGGKSRIKIGGGEKGGETEEKVKEKKQ